MVVKIIWMLLGVDAVFFLVLLFMAMTSHSDTQGNQMAWIMAVLAGVVLLVAALPILLSQRPISLLLSGLLSALPVLVVLVLYIANLIPSKPQEMVTHAMYNFSNGKQRAIAQAIEDNNPVLLQELIRGQELNVRGKQGLTYLQFAIHLVITGVAESQVKESIRVLIRAGANPDLGIVEAVDHLSAATLALFIEAGANPNSEAMPHQSLVFRALKAGKPQNAELLVEKGANPNVLDEVGYSPTMRAALGRCWSTVRFFLERTQANYAHTAPDGKSLLTIVRTMQQNNLESDSTLTRSPDFVAVCEWLEKKTTESNGAQ